MIYHCVLLNREGRERWKDVGREEKDFQCTFCFPIPWIHADSFSLLTEWIKVTSEGERRGRLEEKEGG